MTSLQHLYSRRMLPSSISPSPNMPMRYAPSATRMKPFKSTKGPSRQTPSLRTKQQGLLNNRSIEPAHGVNRGSIRLKQCRKPRPNSSCLLKARHRSQIIRVIFSKHPTQIPETRNIFNRISINNKWSIFTGRLQQCSVGNAIPSCRLLNAELGLKMLRCNMCKVHAATRAL